MTFEEELAEWESMREGHSASPERIAQLILAAETADDPHPALYARLKAVLRDHTGMTAKEAAEESRRAFVVNDLGDYPHTVEKFIPLFLKSRGIEMSFNGVFSGGRDAVYIENQMFLWSSQVKLFAKATIEAAFSNWQVEEKDRLQTRLYAKLAHTPGLDKSELHRFAEYVVEKTGDIEVDTTTVLACEIALENFIHRVKNHIRRRWMNSTHLMLILYGPQGSGKSTAIQHLLAPLGDFSSTVGFEALDDNSKSFDFSTMMAMFFDELAGIGKADVEKLKGIMTAETRQLRQAYAKATVRRLTFTGIGATNRDISTIIRDETGNRRFLQIPSPRLNRATILCFDTLAMWRSVDENAAPPLYTGSNLDVVAAVQESQRFMGPVEAWLAGCDELCVAEQTATDHFEQYLSWTTRTNPAGTKIHSANTFGKELTRLAKTDEYAGRIIITKSNGYSYYRIAMAPGLRRSTEDVLDLAKARAARAGSPPSPSRGGPERRPGGPA